MSSDKETARKYMKYFVIIFSNVNIKQTLMSIMMLKIKND